MSSAEHYVRIRGKIMGPFTVAQLMGLKDRGQLKAFHECSLDRFTWAPASTIAGVFSSSPQSDPVPAPASPALEPGSRIDTPPGQSVFKVPPPPAFQPDPWFVADDMGNRQGPIDATTFKIMLDSGQITPSTMLWRLGMSEWISAETAIPAHFATKPLPHPPGSQSFREHVNTLDYLRKTRLGILLLLIGGATGLLCVPISPVAFVLALIGVGFCMSAPAPVRGPATLTFYFALGTGLLSGVWFISSVFGWEMLGEFVEATYTGALFRLPNEAATAVATGASLTLLSFLGVTFLFAVAMLFTCGAFLHHLLKKMAWFTEDAAIQKLASLNFVVYCVLAVLFVTLIYLWVLIPLLFLSGFKVFSPLILPKIISLVLIIESFLFICMAICYIITLVVLMQLFGRLGQMVQATEVPRGH